MNPKESLRSWFLLNQRDLPFRKKKQAYHIWVSEVMLQQTRVAAMLPLYSKFIQKFPDIPSLALATEEEVLSSWQGLGYYSRARNLRKAAIYLQENFNGSFPKKIEEVLLIPGIGPYTARAVLSIAYDYKYAVLDGNVKRVLARYYLYGKNVLGVSADRELQAIADIFLNKSYPGDHNQALMELGALICLPEKPKCSVCPLSDGCLAREKGQTGTLPIRDKENRKVILMGKILWMQNGEDVLLIREAKPRFLKGLFVLPYFFEGLIPSQDYLPNESILKLYKLFHFNKIDKLIRHTITHHKLNFKLHALTLNLKERDQVETTLREKVEWKWIPIQRLSSEFPSSLAKKVTRSLETSN